MHWQIVRQLVPGANGWMGKYIFCTVAVVVLHRMHTAVLLWHIMLSGNADIYQEKMGVENK